MDDLLALLLVLIAAFLYLRFSIWRDSTALGVRGEVIYSDTPGKKAEPLFSEKLLLTGKPDYVVKQGSAIVPIEVKSCSAPASPYPSHVMQVVSYCALIEDCFGSAPSHGVIKYRNGKFVVPYDKKQKEKLLAQIKEMREALRRNIVPAISTNQNKCSTCGYEELCKES